jgi:predicted N-acetyltransferase YhbS
MATIRTQKIRQEKLADIAAREALLDRAYGPSRFTKSSQSLRQDRLPASGLSFVATDDGEIVGSV